MGEAFRIPVSKDLAMKREDIVTWARRRKIIFIYSISLFNKKMAEADGNSKEVNKYGYLKRRSIEFLAEMNDVLDAAFELEKDKYLVTAYVAERNTTEEDNPYNESKFVKNMYRDNVAKKVGDIRSILYEVRNADHFKNTSYTREITTWQAEARDVKNYILDKFEETSLVRYDYEMLNIS